MVVIIIPISLGHTVGGHKLYGDKNQFNNNYTILTQYNIFYMLSTLILDQLNYKIMAFLNYFVIIVLDFFCLLKG